jgi:sugar phosphate permease
MNEPTFQRFDPKIKSGPIAIPSRPTLVRYQVLAVACSLAFLAYVHRQAFAGGANEIMRDFHLDDRDMGYFMAAFLVSYGLFQVPAGILSDRLGARHLLTFLVLGWSAAMGALALMPRLPGQHGLTLAAVLSLRFLFGMFQAGGFPPLARVIADWIPIRSRGAAQGSIWTFSRLGGAIIPMLLVPIFLLFEGWRLPFLFMAGLGILWAIAFWLWFRNKPAQMKQVNAAERDLIAQDRAPNPAKLGPIPWRRMVRSPSVWGLFLLYGSGGFAAHFFTSLLPVYLEKHRGVDPNTAKVLTGLPLAFGIVACLTGGMLSDFLINFLGSRKWGRRLVPCIALPIGGLCLLATPRVQPIWLFGGLLCFTFFLNDLGMGPAWASCADIGEGYAGTLSAGMNTVGSLCGAASMVMTGALLQEGRYNLLFLIYGACFFLASLCWLMVDATKRLTDPE